MRNLESIGIDLFNNAEINQDLIPFLTELPVEILDGIFSRLSAKEAYELAAVCVSFMQASQNYFYFFNKKIQAKKLVDYDPLSEKLFKENSRKFFLDILNKVYANLSTTSNLQIKQEHAYLILLILCGTEHHLEAFVNNEFFDKSINLAFKKSKTPFELAIDSESLKKLEILFNTYTKHIKFVPLIKYAIQQNQVEMVRYLFEQLTHYKRAWSTKETDLDHIISFGGITNFDRCSWEFLEQAIELRHFNIVNYFLDKMRDLNPEDYRRLSGPLTEEQGKQLELTIEKHKQLLAYVIQAAFINKQFQTVDILIGKATYLEDDFDSICLVLQSALANGDKRWSTKFITLLDKTEYRSKPNYVSIINNLCAHIVDHPTIDEAVIADFIVKFSREIDTDNKKKLAEYVLTRGYIELFKLMLQKEYVTPQDCLCIGLKLNNQSLINDYRNIPLSINIKYEGRNLLAYAIEAGIIDLSEKILRMMVDQFYVPQSEYLLIAIERGAEDIMNLLLLSKVVVNADCIYKAMKLRNWELAELLLPYYMKTQMAADAHGYQPLFILAMDQDNLEAIKFLIGKSDNSNSMTLITQECVLHAFNSKKLAAIELMLPPYMETLEAKERGGYQPFLFLAIMQSYLDGVQFLINNGVSADTLIEDDVDGARLIWDFAAGYARNEEQWRGIQFLLEKSIALRDIQNRGNLPNFNKEAVNASLKSVLIAATQANQYEIAALIILYLGEIKTDPQIKKSMMNALIGAAKAKQDKVVKSIVSCLEFNDIKHSDFEGLSLIHFLAKEGCLMGIVTLLQRCETENKVLKEGSAISYAVYLINSSCAGCTVLETAIRFGKMDVVEWLLKVGVKLKDSVNAFYHAAYSHNISLVLYLLERGVYVSNSTALFQRDPSSKLIQTEDSYYHWAKNQLIGNEMQLDILNLLIQHQGLFPYFDADKKKPPIIELLYYAQMGDIKKFQQCQATHQLELKDIRTTIKGVTPLTKAIDYDQEKFVQFLADIDPQCLKANNFAPLLYACNAKRWKIIYNFLTNPVTENLWNETEITMVYAAAQGMRSMATFQSIDPDNLSIINQIIQRTEPRNRNSSGLSSEICSASQKEAGAKRKWNLVGQKTIVLSQSEVGSEPKQPRVVNTAMSSFWSLSGNKMSIDFLNNAQNANSVEESPTEESKDPSLKSPTQIMDEGKADMDIQKGPG